MRKDKVRTVRNRRREILLKKMVREARKNPNQKTVSAAYSSLDKAAKVHLIHTNKASRLKSRLAKLVASK